MAQRSKTDLNSKTNSQTLIMYRWENKTGHNREIVDNLIFAICFKRIFSTVTKSNCSNAFYSHFNILIPKIAFKL